MSGPIRAQSDSNLSPLARCSSFKASRFTTLWSMIPMGRMLLSAGHRGSRLQPKIGVFGLRAGERADDQQKTAQREQRDGAELVGHPFRQTQHVERIEPRQQRGQTIGDAITARSDRRAETLRKVR